VKQTGIGRGINKQITKISIKYLYTDEFAECLQQLTLGGFLKPLEWKLMHGAGSIVFGFGMISWKVLDGKHII